MEINFHLKSFSDGSLLKFKHKWHSIEAKYKPFSFVLITTHQIINNIEIVYTEYALVAQHGIH